ncbi:hypothetical protein N7474_005059 [Penicillium riverlandense]|uniref:uncharacterized protein n=1 Tax=Penicillium riverlandense TaxID=1903569 RepID=UPI002547B22E|nr:uncharacterized protein N7474_005059 [Penicillium riverlandense]KAJ5819468.1 hypothetical protein N7474_005059 [Penicillium riverlandense]
MKAAETFNVPETTLRRRLNGSKSRAETRANGHKLNQFEEEVLEKKLLEADKRGFSIRPEFLRGMAQILLRDRTQDPTATLGVNWTYKFIKRHPALRTRYNRRITYQRAKQEDPNIIKQWFATRSLRKKRTLSSSPISHIQHLEKAAQMAMNTNLLLRQEIKILREENERKIKKRARRRANLGNDLVLFVQEGQNRVQQLDTQLNEQVDEPRPRPRQRAPQHCSVCRTVGHTIRGCPNK